MRVAASFEMSPHWPAEPRSARSSWPFVAARFLTRFYTAENFGQVQVYLSTYAFVFVIVARRYQLAVLLSKADDVGAAVVAVALTVVATMTALTGVGVALLPSSGLVPHAFRFLFPYRWLWPVTLAGGGTY